MTAPRRRRTDHQPSSTSSRMPIVPRPEDIARRAYELYQRRGGADGHDREDWLQAERELQALGHGVRDVAA